MNTHVNAMTLTRLANWFAAGFVKATNIVWIIINFKIKIKDFVFGSPLNAFLNGSFISQINANSIT